LTIVIGRESVPFAISWSRQLKRLIEPCAAGPYPKSFPNPFSDMAHDQRYTVLQRMLQPCGVTLYVASDNVNGNDVWLWRLFDYSDEHPAPTPDLVEECSQTTTSFRHPAAAATLEVFSDPDGLVAALEIPKGESLDVLAAKRRLTGKDLEQIAVPCLEALMAAHEAQSSHGSIEPGLIFCEEQADGTLRSSLLGFGLIQILSAAQGNPVVISQEEDLHYLGRALYIGMGGSSMRDVAVLSSLSESRPDLPPAVCDWVMNLVHADASKRITRPDVALEHLRTLLGYGAHSTAAVTPDPAWQAAQAQVDQVAAAHAAQMQAYQWQMAAQQMQQAQQAAYWQQQQAWQQQQPGYPAAPYPAGYPQQPAYPTYYAAPPQAHMEMGAYTTPLGNPSTGPLNPAYASAAPAAATGRLAISTQTSPFAIPGAGTAASAPTVPLVASVASPTASRAPGPKPPGASTAPMKRAGGGTGKMSGQMRTAVMKEPLPIVIPGLAKRLGAKVVDHVAILFLLTFLLVTLAALASSGLSPWISGTLALLALLLGAPLYNAITLQTGGATWGKRTFGIKAVKLDGHPINGGQCFGRAFAEILSSFLCIGYIMGLIDGNKRTLHDRIAGTVIVEAANPPKPFPTAPLIGGLVSAGIMVFYLYWIFLR
jgi:uncharacterized RDD family membrane protein YckC